MNFIIKKHLTFNKFILKPAANDEFGLFWSSKTLPTNHAAALLGGEPLTRGDLEEIVSRMAKKKISTKIATNAILASKERDQHFKYEGTPRFLVLASAACNSGEHKRSDSNFIERLSFCG